MLVLLYDALANDLFLGASGLIYGYTGEFSNASNYLNFDMRT